MDSARGYEELKRRIAETSRREAVTFLTRYLKRVPTELEIQLEIAKYDRAVDQVSRFN